MIRRRTLLLGLCLLALFCWPVMAQTSDEGDGENAEAEAAEPEKKVQAKDEYIEVNVSNIPESNTVVSKLPLSQQMTPANVGSVSEALILEQDAYVLSDALKNVSSLNIQAQAGVHDSFFIRGYDSIDGSLLLIDGAIEPEASWYPMYNMVGVEVLKGPAGFLYGVDPLAGVVNMIRKQPVPADFVNFGVSFGSFETVEGTLDWNQSSSDGKKNFRLNAMAYGTENFRDIGENRQYAVNPSFTYEMGNDSQLTFNLEAARTDFSPDTGIPLVNGQLPSVSREQAYGTPFDFSDQEVSRFQIDYQNKLSEKVTLRNKFYVRNLDWKTQGTQLLGVDSQSVPGQSLVIRSSTSLDDDQRYVGNQFEGVLRFNSGSVTHNLLTGLEVRYYTDDYQIGVAGPQSQFNPGGIPAVDLYNPAKTPTQPIQFNPFLNGESTSWDIAPYATYQVVFSEKVELLAGARYDFIRRDDMRTDFQPTFVGQPPIVEDLSRDDGKLSPMLGVVYAPTKTNSIYANAAQSFAPAGVRVFGDLEPEESTGFELGFKKKLLRDKLRTTIAVYQLSRDNVAIPDDNGVTQQAGDQRSRGFEVEFAAEPARGLTTLLAYAYTDAELTSFTERVGFPGNQVTVDRSGNTPAFVPKNLLNLWVSKRFTSGWGVGGGARFIGDQYITEANNVEIPSAWVLDATGFYDFSEFRVSVNVKNLTNEDYELRGFGGNAVIPAYPATVYVGFQFRL